jgi:epoxyqueuosine reductase
VLARACVDTAPLLEREAAQMAGLGFLGKNTMLIAPGQGSGILLGALLTDVPLAREMSQPEAPGPGCGRCRACLDACPTQAFVGEYLLDARRCISYLTIELEGSVPRELRPLVGTRVFGCDECQTTCPFNQGRRQAPGAPEFAPRGAVTTKTLIDLLFLGSAQYRALVRGTALRRTFRIQLCRNAAVALGNSGSAEAIAPLLRAAESHAFELVREHAAWGLGRLGWEFGHDQARKALAELASSPLEAVAREAKIWLDLAPMAPR